MDTKIAEGWYGAIIFATLQVLQYFFISKEIGTSKEYSKGQTVVLTLLFGYSWWYPLKKKPGVP
jgi:hypothetical protein